MTVRSQPAARGLTRRGRETRERIVKTAAELIFDQGIDRTTIDDVRTAANVSSSQLYHYFDDKPALVRAVIEYQADTIVGGQEHFDLSSLRGWRDWRELVVGHERSLNCRGGCPIGSLGSQVSETEPDAREAVAAGFKRWEGTIREGYGRCTSSASSPPRPIPTSSPSPPSRPCKAACCWLRSSATPSRSKPRSTP